MTEVLQFWEPGATSLAQSFLIAIAKKDIISSILYWACESHTANFVLRFEENSSVFMKKQIYIVTNDMLNNIPSIRKAMGF